MIVCEKNLYDFFKKMIKLPNCENKTKTYIISIFSDINNQEDLSQESITLLYNRALETYSFNNFRQIGDWLFLTKCLFPQSLNGASPEYYTAIAQSSYYKCYIIMRREWKIFEELADQFRPLTIKINKCLNSSKREGGFNGFL
jgi:hypothetical protein